MKCVLVHDWLLNLGGGEKVLETLCELYDCPIYTLLVDSMVLSETVFASRKIYPSFLQKLPHVKHYYRNLLPLFPTAIEKFDLSSYDLILSSSHTIAKSVRTLPHQLHICYCHTPLRCVWDQHQFHLSHLNPIKSLIARPILQYMRHYDQKSHVQVNHFIANSAFVAKRIEKHYGRIATVIHPPVDTHLFDISAKKENYYITCSRLVPYKRIDILLSAFSKLPDQKLLIIGDGPEKRRLKSKAPKNVEFLGYLPHGAIREILPKAKAFVFAAEEDFGIAVVEAQAAGVPVIAYGQGGTTETVLSGCTGIFFKEQTPASLFEAICRFERMHDDFEPEKIQKHAQVFSKERFKSQIQDFIAAKCSEFFN